MKTEALFQLTAKRYEKGATLSPCGTYRDSLYRRWDDGPVLFWVMLNPSIAGPEIDDPTVRKTVGFAKVNGFGAVVIENLFRYRATDPRMLLGKSVLELTGGYPETDDAFARIPSDAAVVAGWGRFAYEHKQLTWRVNEVLELLNGRRLRCVRQSNGVPWHPLYVTYGELQEYGGDGDPGRT